VYTTEAQDPSNITDIMCRILEIRLMVSRYDSECILDSNSSERGRLA
jgi:hypothetical protein